MVQYYSYTEYPSVDGVKTNFVMGFDVISPDDIRVRIGSDEIEQTDGTYPWAPDSLSNPQSIDFTGTAPTAGSTVRVYRQTEKASLYKTFDNGPLNAEDLNNSFKKILFIEQEAYDFLTEVSVLFNQVGTVPNPSNETENNDHFLQSSEGEWVIRSAAQVKDTMGLGNNSDVTFNSLTVTDLSAVDVSATNASAADFRITGELTGPLVVNDTGLDWARIGTVDNNPMFLHGKKGIRFAIGGAEKFRIENETLHNYKDNGPNFAALPYAQIGLALSGANKVLAANTAKGWTRVVSDALDGEFAVSGITKNGTGDYTLKLDTTILPAGNYLYYPTLITGAYQDHAIVYSQTSSPPTVSVRTYTSNTTLADKDFQLLIF